MENDGFPIADNVTTIEQVDRIQTYLDNKAIDAIGWIAGSLDIAQQGITTVAGTVLKSLHNRLKKELQRQGRIISKYQKKIDYAAIDTQAIAESDKQEIDKLLDDAPIDIDELVSGDVPNILADRMGVDGIASTATTTTTTTTGNGISTRINPDTCEIEVTGNGFSFTGTGIYDQACLNDKGGVVPPPPPPPPPPPTGSGNCQFPLDANVQYVLAKLCDNPFINPIQVYYAQGVYEQLQGSLNPRYPFIYRVNTNSFSAGDNFSPFGGGNVSDFPAIITLPYKRSQENRESVWSEDFSIKLNNTFPSNGVQPGNPGAYSFNSYMDMKWNPIPISDEEVEWSFASIPDEWGVA